MGSRMKFLWWAMLRVLHRIHQGETVVVVVPGRVHMMERIIRDERPVQVLQCKEVLSSMLLERYLA